LFYIFFWNDKGCQQEGENSRKCRDVEIWIRKIIIGKDEEVKKLVEGSGSADQTVRLILRLEQITAVEVINMFLSMQQVPGRLPCVMVCHFFISSPLDEVFKLLLNFPTV
jgi:hypothetical protein